VKVSIFQPPNLTTDHHTTTLGIRCHLNIMSFPSPPAPITPTTKRPISPLPPVITITPATLQTLPTPPISPIELSSKECTRTETIPIPMPIPPPLPESEKSSSPESLLDPLKRHLHLIHPSTPTSIISFIATRFLTHEKPLGHDGSWTPLWALDGYVDLSTAGLGQEAGRGCRQKDGGKGREMDRRVEEMYEVARRSWGLMGKEVGELTGEGEDWETVETVATAGTE